MTRDFAARNLDNCLWVTFTRADPANDVHGVGAFMSRKHWGCRGPVVIDARLKPHMPPPLEEDPAVTKRVDALFARGGPLQGSSDRRGHYPTEFADAPSIASIAF